MSASLVATVGTYVECQGNGVHCGRMISYRPWAIWIGIQLKHLDDGGTDFVHDERLVLQACP